MFMFEFMLELDPMLEWSCWADVFKLNDNSSTIKMNNSDNFILIKFCFISVYFLIVMDAEVVLSEQLHLIIYGCDRISLVDHHFA